VAAEETITSTLLVAAVVQVVIEQAFLVKRQGLTLLLKAR
jgi:hypothetical protein